MNPMTIICQHKNMLWIERRKNKWQLSLISVVMPQKNDLKCMTDVQFVKMHLETMMELRFPLVWQHLHDEPTNVLRSRGSGKPQRWGIRLLFIKWNRGREACRRTCKHGDIKFLSIYANQLLQKGQDVLHGAIREVSLVLAGQILEPKSII